MLALFCLIPVFWVIVPGAAYALWFDPKSIHPRGALRRLL